MREHEQLIPAHVTENKKPKSIFGTIFALSTLAAGITFGSAAIIAPQVAAILVDSDKKIEVFGQQIEVKQDLVGCVNGKLKTNVSLGTSNIPDKLVKDCLQTGHSKSRFRQWLEGEDIYNTLYESALPQ